MENILNTQSTANSTKHIAIIIDSLAGGGAEKVMLTLASELVNQGHCVSFFSLKNTADYEVPSNIKLIFPLKSYSGRVRGWFNRRSLANMLKASIQAEEQAQGEFDLVLVNLYESYRLASACDLKHCFYIIHNSYVQELKREMRMGPIKYFYMKSILKMLEGKDLIAVSKGVKGELEQTRLFKPASVKHIYNPFDISLIQSQSQAKIDSPVPEKFILHVGRAAKAKRHDVLFKALKKVNPAYQLVCLSSNVKKLKKLSARLEVEDRVVIPGFQSNPYAWMNRAEVVVLSSDFEGLSMVLLEAIISGTKVVSTNCPHGPSEIMQGPLAQFLVPVQDSDALADAINKAIEADLELDATPMIDQVSTQQITAKYLALIE
jgi:glycosyltransferase involved in cell wall biosynthesis